jgi:hypothetical protein
MHASHLLTMRTMPIRIGASLPYPILEHGHYHHLGLGSVRRSRPRVWHGVLATLLISAPKALLKAKAGATPPSHSHWSKSPDGTSTCPSGRTRKKSNSSDPFDLDIDKHLVMAFDLVTV